MKQVEKMVKQADYWHVPDTNTTVCCLTFKNGFTEIGVYRGDDGEIVANQAAYKDAINNSSRYLLWQQKHENLEQTIRDQVRELTDDIRSQIDNLLSDLYSCSSSSDEPAHELTKDVCDLWIKMAKEDSWSTTIQGVINSRYKKQKDRLEYAHKLAKRFSELFHASLDLKVRKEVIYFTMEQTKVNQEARQVFADCLQVPGESVEFVLSEDLNDEQANQVFQILEQLGLDVTRDLSIHGGDAIY